MTQVTHLTTQTNFTFSNSNNVTFGVNGSTVTASASYPAQTAFEFSNANGVTFGTNGSTVTASVQTNYQAPGAYLTTAALSNHSHGNPTLSLAGGLSGATASNSAGFTLSLTQAAGVASPVVLSAGTVTGSFSQWTFSNSNNISFGFGTGADASKLTASASYVNDLTSGRAGVGETVGTIAGTDLAMTVNTDGVSVGYPKWITTYANDLTSGRAGVGATIGTTAGTDLKMTVDTNGVNISHPKWITTYNAQTVQPVAASGSNGSFNFSTLNFVTGNGATFYTDATGIRLSYTVPAPGGGDAIRGIAAGGATLTTNTVNFSNANGVSFGFGAAGNSTVMTASHNAITTGALSDHSHGNPTLALTNLTGTTASASNGFTLSLSAANPGGGAGATLSHFSPPWGASGRATNSSLGNNTLYFQPFDLPFYLSASRINFYVSVSGALSAGNSTGTCWQRASYGLYSQDSDGASTQSIRLITSYAITHLSHSMSSNTAYAATHYFGLSNATSHSTKQTGLSTSNATTYLATNLNGGRVLAFPLNSTLTPGRYWLAFGNATTAGNAMTNGLSVQITSVGLQPEIRPFGQASAATNASVFRAMSGWGSYSATTTAYPSLIALSTNAIRHGVAMTQIHFDILGIATSTNQI